MRSAPLPHLLPVLFLGALLAALLPAVAIPPPVRAEEEASGDRPARLPRWRKGVQEGTVAIDGQEEAFTALVPRGYSTRKRYPTVLLLHGNGGKAASFLRVVKPMAGKRPPLLIALERCDNHQDAIGYTTKYLDALRKVFAIDEERVYALGFSGGGFRLWDDVVCQAEALPRFRGVALVGSAKQSFDPPEKPEKAPTVLLVGDVRDPNFKSRPEAESMLKQKGYEVIVHEHAQGHAMPRKEIEKVFEWIASDVKASRRSR